LADAHVIKIEIKTVWPRLVAVVKGINTNLWTIVCRQHAHWEAAICKLGAIQKYCNTITCRGEDNPQVVPPTIHDFFLLGPYVWIVINRECNQLEFALAFLMTRRQQPNYVARVGPKQQLHIRTDVT
jgi:hypothetical protein